MPRVSAASAALPTAPSATGPRLAGVWLAVVAVALVVRLLHWWGQMRGNPFFWAPVMDEAMHHEWAQQIARGAGLGARPFFRAPLYYYLLAGLYGGFGVNIAVARLIGCVLGAATCGLIAQLAWQAGAPTLGAAAGRRLFLLSWLLAAVYWPLVHFDAQLLTVVLENFLNVAVLVLLIQATRRGGWGWYAAAGFAWGLAALARPNILALAPALVAYIALAPRLGRGLAAAPRPRGEHPAGDARATGPADTGGWLRRSARDIGLVCAGAAVVILPVTLRNRLSGGEWVLIATNGGVNFYIGNNPRSDGIAAIVPGTRPDWQGGYEDTHSIPEHELGRSLTEREVADYWYGKAWDWIRAAPGAWLAHTVHKFSLFFSPVEIPNNQPSWFFARQSGAWMHVLGLFSFPLVAALAAGGVVTLGRAWRDWLLPLLYLLTYTGSVVLFFVSDRYRLPVTPVLLALAAWGMWQVGQRVGARAWRRLAAPAAAAALMLGFVFSNPPALARHASDTSGWGHANLAAHFAARGLQEPALRERAREHYAAALQLRPRDATLPLAYAAFLAQWGEREAAAAQFRQALELAPDMPEVHAQFGQFRYAQGDFSGATEHLRAAVAARPAWTSRREQLGLALLQSGEPAAAAEQFEEVLRQKPGSQTALLNLGTAYTQLGRLDAAVARYEELLRLSPGQPAATQGLAGALHQAGRTAEAIAALRAGVQARPNDERLLRALSWLLATAADDALRDGAAAVAHAAQALQVAGSPSPGLLDTQAAALAAAGRFDEAVQTATRASAAARAAGQAEFAATIDERRALYARREVYRDVRATKGGS